MKYLRLIKSVLSGIRRSYIVWRMNEITRSGKELFSCVSCGMARSEPCEHWQNLIERGSK